MTATGDTTAGPSATDSTGGGPAGGGPTGTDPSATVPTRTGDTATGDTATEDTATGDTATGAVAETESPSRGSRFAARAPRFIPGRASLAALITWIVGFPAALAIVKVLDANPLTGRGYVLPALVGIFGGAVILGLALRRGSDTIVGVAAGGYAAWVGLTLLASYHGTPFGDSGLRGDSARLAAMATRFSETWRPVDGIVPDVPAGYPPLFPWLVGRASVIIDKPAWSMIGYAEALTISAAVLVAFLLWRGLAPAPVALALAVIPPWVFGQPRKSYEILVFAAFMPWVLRTFLGRPRQSGGLHWMAAGIIGGLIVQTFQAPLVFSALGIIAIIAVAWRQVPDRRAYVGHLVGTLATAFLVAAWYLIQYLHATFTIGGRMVSDFFISPAIVDDPVGVWFANPALVPPGLTELLALVGLFGLVWYWRSTWWARPILLLALSAYAYRWSALIVFAGTGHTLFLQYTSRIIGIVLVSAGVLSIARAGPGLARRLTLRPRREFAVLGVAMLLVAAAVAATSVWMPQPPGLNNVTRANAVDNVNLATFAHAEPLPNGKPPRYAARGVTVAWFPAEPVRDAITRTLGPDARPVTLSPDERLFAYYPYPGYVPVARDAANTWVHFDERVAELQRVAAIKDPAEFARASENTRFGGIDVFVLRIRPDGWRWGNVQFDPAQFDPAHWEVTDTLPSALVVAVRRP